MDLQVLQWNCRSIYRNLKLICLQKTHLSCKNQSHLPYYTILCKDQPLHLGKGGGLETMGIKINHVHLFNVYN